MRLRSVISRLVFAFVATTVFGSCFANPKLDELLDAGTKEQILFSSDGQSILITQTENGDRTLKRLSIHDGSETSLADQIRNPFGVDISLKRSLLAVCGADGVIGGQLYLVDSDGNATIIRGADSVLWPQFSPSGEEIVFSTVDDRGNAHLERVSLDSHLITRLTSGNYADILPTHSADGQEIIFWRAKTFGHASPVGADAFHDWHLYKLDLRSQKLEELTSASHYTIDYSRPVEVGSRILFCVDHYMTVDLWEYDTQGRSMNVINLPPEYANKLDENGDPMVHIQNPHITPGGNQVLFEMAISEAHQASNAPEEMYSLNLEDGSMEQLTELSLLRIADFDISPDGSMAAVLTIGGMVYLVDLETQETKRLK